MVEDLRGNLLALFPIHQQMVVGLRADAPHLIVVLNPTGRLHAACLPQAIEERPVRDGVVVQIPDEEQVEASRVHAPVANESVERFENQSGIPSVIHASGMGHKPVRSRWNRLGGHGLIRVKAVPQMCDLVCC